MEQKLNSSNKLKNTIVPIAIILIFVFVIPKLIHGDFFGNKAIDSAEKYVNQQVYTSLGIPCEKYNSEIIYKSGDIKLISVKFYTANSSVAVGSYCVYCDDEYVVNSTTMMGAEYSYKEHIEELKALFGI